METGEALKLDNQLCFAVYACAREITKLYYPLLKELNLTYTQYVTMLALWERDGLSVKQLGERLYLDSGTLTPLLKKLEATGLLTRRRSSEDERVVGVHLTDKGTALRARAAKIPERLFCQAGVPFEEADLLRRQITGMLQKVQHFQSKEE